MGCWAQICIPDRPLGAGLEEGGGQEPADGVSGCPVSVGVTGLQWLAGRGGDDSHSLPRSPRCA